MARVVTKAGANDAPEALTSVSKTGQPLCDPSAGLAAEFRTPAPSAVRCSTRQAYQNLRTSVAEYLGAVGRLIGSKVPETLHVVLFGRLDLKAMRAVPERGEFRIFAGRTYDAQRPLRFIEAVVMQAIGEVYSHARANSAERVGSLFGREVGLLAKQVAEVVNPEKFGLIQQVSEILHAQGKESYCSGVGLLIAERIGVPGRLGCSLREAVERIIAAHVGLHSQPRSDEVVVSRPAVLELVETAHFIAICRVLKAAAVRVHASEFILEDLAQVQGRLEGKFESERKAGGVFTSEHGKSIISILEKCAAFGHSENLASFDELRGKFEKKYGLKIPTEELLRRGDEKASRELRVACEEFERRQGRKLGFLAESLRPLLGGLSVSENLRRAAWNLLELGATPKVA